MHWYLSEMSSRTICRDLIFFVTLFSFSHSILSFSFCDSKYLLCAFLSNNPASIELSTTFFFYLDFSYKLECITSFKMYNFIHYLFTLVSFSTTPKSVSDKMFLNFSKLPLRYFVPHVRQVVLLIFLFLCISCVMQLMLL